MARKVVINRKVDLDLALTALLLGVSGEDEIVVVRDKAEEGDLLDPNVICIECGGSGEVQRGNFDHHDTSANLPPACMQAFDLLFEGKSGGPSSALGLGLGKSAKEQGAFADRVRRLVEYVSLLDTSGPQGLKERGMSPEDAFPTLSYVFSGMLLVVKDPVEQLFKGMEILRKVLELGVDPFGPLPAVPEWEGYIRARRKNDEELSAALARAEFFQTERGLRAGFLETEAVGALGALYRAGCQVAIVYSPNFGDPPVAKYTIGGNGLRVDALKAVLDGIEPGWGGPAHGTILGSPRSGSKLRPEEVKELVRRNL